MPKRKVNEKRFEDIKSILNLIENNESGFISEDRGHGGFSSADRKTYEKYDDLEQIAEDLNPKGARFMSDIVKIAIMYDKKNPFDKAQKIIVDSHRDADFLKTLDSMIASYSSRIKDYDAGDAIDISIESFYKNYKKANLGLSNDPKFVAERIFEIVKIMLSKMKLESRPKSMQKIREKIKTYNPIELSNKKSPGGAAVGVSLALIKNILIARDTFFIKRVIDELSLIVR